MKKIWKKLAALTLAGIMAMTPMNYSYAANAGNAIAKGIDVSKHNGAIDWNSVAASGYSFAFIKVGSTYSGLDPFFDANIRGAQAAGLKVGVYIYSYATTVEQAQNEANLVIAWLNNYTVNFPVVFDIEDSCHKGMSPDQLQALINTFCMSVAGAGYYPMVYSSKNWFNQRIGNVPFDKWVAQYADNLEYSGASFWQSSSSGVVPGVGTNVDIDYQFKDFSKLIVSDGFVDRFGLTMFFSNYKMQRGWLDYNGTRYYLGLNGVLQRNCWFSDEKGTYFLSADGSISRGQTAILGQNYYFDINGAMQTGWVDLPGTGRFYYSPLTGTMVQGWFADASGTYYFSTKDGHMLVSDVTINGNDYYFGLDGKMQTGLVTKPDGNMYFYDAAGVLVKNQQTPAGDVIYVSDKNGVVTPVPAVPAVPVPEAVPVQ